MLRFAGSGLKTKTTGPKGKAQCSRRGFPSARTALLKTKTTGREVRSSRKAVQPKAALQPTAQERAALSKTKTTGSKGVQPKVKKVKKSYH
jgi:hypothetical protein